MPKQFQPLVGDLSTYQQTLKRVSDKSLYAEALVITNEDFRFFARRQAEEIDLPATVVLEPARRDSAAAMAAAALLADRREKRPFPRVHAVRQYAGTSRTIEGMRGRR